MRKLSELKQGEQAVIYAIENTDIYVKLMEMGCIPGEKVKVENIAAFGDPIAITVAGYNLSLRLNEAECIIVTDLANPLP